MKNRAYNEILEILNNIPQEDYNKIPSDVIEIFRKNQDMEYNFFFDIDKSFDEQKISRDTYILYLYLYKKYIADEEEREKINQMLLENEKLNQKIKKQKYDIDVFSNRNKNDNDEENKEEKELVVRSNNIFTRIIEKIICIIKKR